MIAALIPTDKLLRAAAVAVGLSMSLIAIWSLEDPGVARLAGARPETTAFIEQHRARARAAGRPDHVSWNWVPASAIAPELRLAVLVSEDIGFFSHRGFAPSEMRIALTEALEDREVPRGASTITQQLAKNLWLSPSRNPLRKLREAVLTWRLERALDKDRILEVYLNVVEFGPGIYGAEAAAGTYFGKPAAFVSAHEAALLAASLPRPASWNPRSASPAYHAHVAVVEERMRRTEFLARRLGVPVTDTLPMPDTLPPDTLTLPDTAPVPDAPALRTP